MKEYNFDNINEFFENLMNSKNAKLNMMRVYGAYERECEENKRKQEIEDKFKIAGYHCTCKLIDDNMAVVVAQKANRPFGYFAYANNKASYIQYSTFEQALLCAISIKLTGREDATEWMWKLVGGENNP